MYKRQGDDAEALGRAAGHEPRVYATFEAPLSPHRAAALEGRPVSDDVLTWIAALRGDVVLVEGVGGWRVPVRADPPLWVADLARATGGPVVIVAPDRLGVLNQALLTAEAVRRDGLTVAAVVLNRGAAPALGREPHDPSRAWNEADLRALLDAPVVTFDRLPTGGEAADDDVVAAAGAAVWRVILAGRPSSPGEEHV